MNDQFSHLQPAATTTVAPEQKPLRTHVLEAIDRYFSSLNGSEPANVHSVVLDEIEAAMYESVMRYTRGNQSRAAKVLGVSRGTLRTKLMQYFDTTHVGGVYHQ